MSAKCTRASCGRKGKPFTVQSQNVEGWAMQTLLQTVTFRDECYTITISISSSNGRPHQWKARPPSEGIRDPPPMENDPTVEISH
jgi:hypothetical protein